MRTENTNHIIIINDSIIPMTAAIQGRGCGLLGWSCQSNLFRGVEIL